MQVGRILQKAKSRIDYMNICSLRVAFANIFLFHYAMKKYLHPDFMCLSTDS